MYQTLKYTPTKAEMRRIGILNTVSRVASSIAAWGPGAGADKTLVSAILYYGEFRCTSVQEIAGTLAYMAEFVPGGLNRDLTELTREERRNLMNECHRKADIEVKQIRAVGTIAAPIAAE